MIKSITPFLWFTSAKDLEEATKFYPTVFPDAKVTHTTPGPDGLMWASFELQGQEFYALNGGPQYKFTEAISLFVSVETQEEVDTLWEKLTANGGEAGNCGWLKDKFGLSWQIIPTKLSELLGSPDQTAAGRVMQAMLKMNKLIIADLQQAHDQK